MSVVPDIGRYYEDGQEGVGINKFPKGLIFLGQQKFVVLNKKYDVPNSNFVRGFKIKP